MTKNWSAEDYVKNINGNGTTTTNATGKIVEEEPKAPRKCFFYLC